MTVDWVETRGRTIEEAKDAALDLLGIDAADAEFEILDEPRTGLFGRLKSEARVRARIRPSRPRPKQDRRGRRRSRDRKPSEAGGQDERSTTERASRTKERLSEAPAESEPAAPSGTGAKGSESRKKDNMVSTLSADEQAEVARAFLAGLLERLAVDATLEVVTVDENIRDVCIEGDELGVLIGPKGRTLDALQDVVRTVVQREAGSSDARVRVDVAGYRQRRRDALARFAVAQAEAVRESGVARMLEPMNAADRKVVHDALLEVDGVVTSSEGDEPRRRVVISPST